MKKNTLTIAVIVIALFFTACGDNKTTAPALSDVEKKLIGDWHGREGRGTQINLEADNKIIAVNEDGHRDQLKVEGKTISALTWPVTPSLSEDGKTLDWGNGTAWTR